MFYLAFDRWWRCKMETSELLYATYRKMGHLLNNTIVWVCSALDCFAFDELNRIFLTKNWDPLLFFSHCVCYAIKSVWFKPNRNGSVVKLIKTTLHETKYYLPSPSPPISPIWHWTRTWKHLWQTKKKPNYIQHAKQFINYLTVVEITINFLHHVSSH